MLPATRELRFKGFDVAHRCYDAYSASAYRSWPAVATFLLRHGFTEQETEAIMRSKWTRWARDAESGPKFHRYGEYPASILAPMIEAIREDAAELVAGTFGTAPQSHPNPLHARGR